ncbi:MAG: hypothetical protein HY298_08405 [Verrucomicrobia bacterium]|nr:hypothetical protein [Verrucomicrobiota bacterium]
MRPQSSIATLHAQARHARLISKLVLLAGMSLVILFETDAAYATFHLWDISEVYSSADGTVQFIELTNNSSATIEGSLSGITITCYNAQRTNSYTFPNDLLGSTLNKTFLIGTTNSASVPAGVTPDYFVPDNFLLLEGGTINYGDVDIVVYTNLPTNGVASLVRSGASMIFSITNSPKNFENVSNSIVPVRLQSLTQTGNAFVLSFATARGTNGAAGPNYAVEFNTAIASTGWQKLANVGGDGTIKAVTNTNPPDPQRFYRLRVP